MKEKIIEIVEKVLDESLIAGVGVDFSVPEEAAFGHYSTNLAMRLAHAQGKKPLELAREFAARISEGAPAGFFEKVEAVMPGFINVWLSKEAIREGLIEVERNKTFGRSKAGGGKKVIVEYSSVNIAKPFHLGHFRNTIIGAALANILEASGYDVVRWNYLGDWGTQFGKLIAAYKLWGKKEDLEQAPIEILQKLYVRFHAEIATDPELEKRGQEEFQKLESGDKENRELWEWFKKESLIEFERMYRLLGVTFDVWLGESFFAKEGKSLVAGLLERGFAERSEGAIIVRLDEYNLPPALVEKSDGASLYLTRDIANLDYRLKKYKPAKIWYVVANDQALAFDQLFAVAKKLGMDSAELKHIKYGLVLGESGKKFSTRRGEAIGVQEVVEKSIALARGIVEEKAYDLSPEEKEAVAEAVGLGALKYNDLKENRLTDITFDWDKMLDFGGDSGPYLQYTYARLQSILRKAGAGQKSEKEPRDVKAVKKVVLKKYADELDAGVEFTLMRKIFELPDVVRRAGELHATSLLAAYLYKLAVAANRFYEAAPILTDDNAPRRAARLALAAIAARTIASGLHLLGIQALEKI